MQGCSNTLKLLQSCTKTSIWWYCFNLTRSAASRRGWNEDPTTAMSGTQDTNHGLFTGKTHHRILQQQNRRRWWGQLISCLINGWITGVSKGKVLTLADSIKPQTIYLKILQWARICDIWWRSFHIALLIEISFLFSSFPNQSVMKGLTIQSRLQFQQSLW